MAESLEQYFEQTAILVTSHPKQHVFMDTAFESWAGYDGFMLLGYDHTDADDLPLERWMPPVSGHFVTGKPAGCLGHFRGELWQLKIGANILRQAGYKYLYKTAADNCCYRWRNLKNIFKVLIGKNHDLILCGTTQIFGKLDVFCACMDLWSEDVTRCGGAELFLNYALKELKVRDCRMKVDWWRDILGLVHLQGEFAINTGINIFESWVVGQMWGGHYRHRDLDPRIKYLKPHIRSQYEQAIRENKEASRSDGPVLPDAEV
jgi:hypothetical protein